MKNLFQLASEKCAKFVFQTSEVNEIAQESSIDNTKKVNDAMDYSRTAQNTLGVEIGLACLANKINVRKVQKNDSVSAITRGFQKSGLLDVSNIYAAKAKYKVGLIDQAKIYGWNSRHSGMQIPQSVADKMIAGDDFPMGYANILYPDQYVYVEEGSTDTVIISDELPVVEKDEKEKEEGGVKKMPPTKELKKTKDLKEVKIAKMSPTKVLKLVVDLKKIGIEEMEATKLLQAVTDLKKINLEKMDLTKSLEVVGDLTAVRVNKMDPTRLLKIAKYLKSVNVEEMEATDVLQLAKYLKEVNVSQMDETKILEITKDLKPVSVEKIAITNILKIAKDLKSVDLAGS